MNPLRSTHHRLCLAAAAGILLLGAASGQAPFGPPRPGAGPAAMPPLPSPGGGEAATESALFARAKISDAPVDLWIKEYAAHTGRTLLQGPGLPSTTISLHIPDGVELTLDEYLHAIESVLSMHGIALLRIGDKFLKVVPNAKAIQEAPPITMARPDDKPPDSDELVSQMIALKHIDIAEAQKSIDFLKHPHGQVQLFERINSILITDSQANVNRIVEIIGYVDQPAESREEPIVVPIYNAKASEIKQKLEEIIADHQATQKQSSAPRAKQTGQPGVVRPTLPGVIRAKAQDQPEATKQELIEMAERGALRGNIKIVADDRTNTLIFITRPENMQFFEKIVEVLDVPTEPDITVRVIRLEYADAKSVEATLNSLIGGTKSEKAGGDGRTVAARGEGEAGRSAALREFVRQRQESTEPAAPGKSKIGELSAENIKILADERTNALIIMAAPSDMLAILEIIRDMDIMLSQVMIEAVIIQVDLDDNVSSGVQWVQRSLIAYQRRQNGSRDPIGAFAGSAGAGRTARDATTLSSLGAWSSTAGLTAYFTHFGLNMDAVLNMLASDSRTQVLSAPVIVTTDNTEAVLTSSSQKYFLKGSTVDQFGNVRPETEIRDIGLDLTVTPHINEQRNVMMEIDQKVSDEGAPQTISEELGEFPTTVTRSFKASIAVRDRESIVLGGLVRNSRQTSRSGVPLLQRIPLLGWLFRSSSDRDQRAEVVVFVTPYVLDTPEDIAAESERRKESLNIEGLWLRSWSGSRLADPPDADAAGERREERFGVRGVRGDLRRAPAEESGPAPESEAAPKGELDPATIEFMRLQEERVEENVTEVEP